MPAFVPSQRKRLVILTSDVNGGSGQQEQQEEAGDYATTASVLGTELFPGETDVRIGGDDGARGATVVSWSCAHRTH